MSANIYHRLHLNYDLPRDLEISLATTEQDIKSALHLVHLAYLARGYTNDQHHQMRLNIFHAQPSTAVVVGKMNGQVVATGSLIVDSFSGIPSEKVQNLYLLRQKYLQIVEGSALAVDPNYRGASNAITLPLIKYLIFYAKNYLHADLIVANVNPKQERFYRDILLIDSFASNIDSFDFVQGAPGTILGLDLGQMEARYQQCYGQQEAKSNLYQYMFHADFPQLHYPRHGGLGHLPRYLGPELLAELFISKQAIIPQLSLPDLLMLRVQYSGPEYDACFAHTFLSGVKFSAREPRMSTAWNATFAGIPVQIKNISYQGSKIVFLPANALASLSLNQVYSLNIEVDKEIMPMKGKITWRQENAAGVQLIDPQFYWFQLLSSLAKGRIVDQFQAQEDYPNKIAAKLNQVAVELVNLSISEVKVYFSDNPGPEQFKVNERYFLSCHFQQRDFKLEVVLLWTNQYMALLQLIGPPLAWQHAVANYQKNGSEHEKCA